MIVRIDYPQPSVRLDLWGGVSGQFAGLDPFGRVVDQRWLRYGPASSTSSSSSSSSSSSGGTTTDIDRYKYGYDLNSNRVWKQNVVSGAAGVPLDEFYAYDPLNRLTGMQRGTLNATRTGITGTPVAEQDWTLDPTGNWTQFATLASGSATMTQTRTANTANEITAIGSVAPPPPPSGTLTPPAWVTPAYDPAGNMTTLPQPANPTSSYTAVYDAWNRMTSISAGGTLVGKYQYDGRNRRIVKLTYTGGSLTETRHFYFTDHWQDVEERVGTSTGMDKQYVWGIRYVDELVCRDGYASAGSSSSSSSSSSSAAAQRLFALQDANFNVTGITNASGTVLERYLFDPYGARAIFTSAWAGSIGTAYFWTVASQGLQSDGESALLDNRYRYFNSSIGRFLSMDPSVDSEDVEGVLPNPNAYEYVTGDPVNRLDPTGQDPFAFGVSLLQTTGSAQNKAGPPTRPTTRPTPKPIPPNPPPGSPPGDKQRWNCDLICVYRVVRRPPDCNPATLCRTIDPTGGAEFICHICPAMQANCLDAKDIEGRVKVSTGHSCDGIKLELVYLKCSICPCQPPSPLPGNRPGGGRPKNPRRPFSYGVE